MPDWRKRAPWHRHRQLCSTKERRRMSKPPPEKVEASVPGPRPPSGQPPSKLRSDPILDAVTPQSRSRKLAKEKEKGKDVRIHVYGGGKTPEEKKAERVLRNKWPYCDHLIR